MKINKNSLQARIKNLSSQKGIPSNNLHKIVNINIFKKVIKNTYFYVRVSKIDDGGVGETRTLAPVARSTSLAGKPLHQLGYYSSSCERYIS